MKLIITLLVFLFISSISVAQQGDKLKGSKTVTIENRSTSNFTAVFIQDDIQVSFIKADSTGIEIESDDNLQEALKSENKGGDLYLSMANKITSYKKFEVKIYYTDKLKSIEATDESKLMILEEMDLDKISFKLNKKAKLYLNLKSKEASFELNDDSSAEMNIKSQKTHFVMTKESVAKVLVASTELKVDQYQKSKSSFEGDVIDLKLRMDNNSKYIGKYLTAKNVEIMAEAYSNLSVFAEKTCIINAFANSEIELFGEPILELKKFTGKTILKKNTLK